MLERQSGLLPKRSYQLWPPLHRAQSTAGVVADLLDGRCTEVGDFAILQVIPNAFDRIQFRRVGGQELELHRAFMRFDPSAHGATAVDVEAIPDDQQRSMDLRAQRLEEFEHLRGTDGAGEKAKVEAPKRDARDRRELAPMKAVLQHRRLADGRPAPRQGGPLGESRLVYE